MNRDEEVESMQNTRSELLEKENAALRRKSGQPCTMCRNHKANDAFLLWDDLGRGYMASNLSNCPYCGRFLIENFKNQQ